MVADVNALPDFPEQFAARYDPVAPPNQKDDQIENTRFHRNQVAVATKLVFGTIELEFEEAVNDRCNGRG